MFRLIRSSTKHLASGATLALAVGLLAPPAGAALRISSVQLTAEAHGSIHQWLAGDPLRLPSTGDEGRLS